MNPRIGSGLKYGRRVVKENRRGGEKPRGRHADGDRHPHLEGSRSAAETRSRGRRESDFTA
jgi:hypothetical protein